LFVVSKIGPAGFAVQPRELEKFLAERLVVLSPPVPAPLGLLRGQRLGR
jgi:hypothetical protein